MSININLECEAFLFRHELLKKLLQKLLSIMKKSEIAEYQQNVAIHFKEIVRKSIKQDLRTISIV